MTRLAGAISGCLLLTSCATRLVVMEALAEAAPSNPPGFITTIERTEIEDELARVVAPFVGKIFPLNEFNPDPCFLPKPDGRAVLYFRDPDCLPKFKTGDEFGRIKSDPFPPPEFEEPR